MYGVSTEYGVIWSISALHCSAAGTLLCATYRVCGAHVYGS